MSRTVDYIITNERGEKEARGGKRKSGGSYYKESVVGLAFMLK